MPQTNPKQLQRHTCIDKNHPETFTHFLNAACVPFCPPTPSSPRLSPVPSAPQVPVLRPGPVPISHSLHSSDTGHVCSTRATARGAARAHESLSSSPALSAPLCSAGDDTVLALTAPKQRSEARGRLRVPASLWLLSFRSSVLCSEGLAVCSAAWTASLVLPPGSPQPPSALNLPGGLRERGSSAGAGNHPRGLVTSVKAAGLRGDTGTR